MQFRPGIPYVTCEKCRGRKHLSVPTPHFPGVAYYNRQMTRFVLSMMFVLTFMWIVPILAGRPVLELVRYGIVGGMTVLAISIAGGFAVQWVLRVLTTVPCDRCRGTGWVPGEIPP